MINFTTWVIVIAVLAILIVGIVVYIKKVPHGWVQFRTGLILKFLPPLDSQPVVPLRHAIEQFAAKRRPGIQRKLPVSDIHDIEIPTRHGNVPARIYHHKDDIGDFNIVFIHGGGWCVGSIDTYEEVCRRLTRSTQQTVISIGYSLAPEHKFPRGHEECLDCIEQIALHADKMGLEQRPLVLIGDSAGGNLILTSYYKSADSVKEQVQKMVPVYPAVDSHANDYSFNAFANGYYLTRKSMMQFTEGLISQESDLEDIRLNPIKEDKQVSFPETFVITAQFDPLRDQAEGFARKIHKEGHRVLSKRYKSTVHAFFGLADFGTQGVKAIDDITLFIKGQEIQDLRVIE